MLQRDFALNGTVVFEKKLFVISFEEEDYAPLEAVLA